MVTCLCCALLGLQLRAQTLPEQPLIIHARLAPEFNGIYRSLGRASFVRSGLAGAGLSYSSLSPQFNLDATRSRSYAPARWTQLLAAFNFFPRSFATMIS